MEAGRRKNQLIKINGKSIATRSRPKQLVYETNEEQLERETGQKVYKSGKSKKKTSPDASPELIPPELLPKEQTTDKNNNDKEHLSPPIFTSGVKDFNSLKGIVLQDVKYDASFKMLANGEINTMKSEDFGSIVRMLKEVKVQTNSPSIIQPSTPISVNKSNLTKS